MRLARDDNVVEAFAPNRSDQPFGKTVLPRRRRCSGLVPNAHSVQSERNDGAIDAIPIADEVARRLIPRECLADLASNPVYAENLDPGVMVMKSTQNRV